MPARLRPLKRDLVRDESRVWPAPGIGAAEVMSVTNLRTEFLDYFDTANRAYKRARDFCAGDTQTMRSDGV